MIFRIVSIVLLATFAATGVAQGQSFKLNKLNQTYMNRSRDVKVALAKLIDDPSNGAKSRWNSKCKQALDVLSKFEEKFLSKENKKWKAEQIAAWKAVMQIGSEIADANFHLEEALGDMRKSLLQSRRDKKEFEKKSSKAIVSKIDQVHQFLKGYVSESEKWNKAFNDLKSGNQDLGEYSGDLDDYISDIVKYKTNFEKLRRGVDSVVNLYDHVFYHIQKAKETQFEQSTRDIRQQRRRLERLVRLKMNPNGEKFFGEFEKAIEKAALSRLDIYQEVLDEWIEVNQSFKKPFNQFMADGVAPTIAQVGKMIPKAILGYGLPSHLYKPDETIDSLLDTLSNFFSAAPKFYIKDGREALDFTILELKEKHELALEALDIKLESRIGRATTDSKAETDEMNRLLKSKGEEIKTVRKGTRSHDFFQADIKDLKEDLELESKALKKEIEFIKKKIAAERSQLTKEHEAEIAEISAAIKKL